MQGLSSSEAARILARDGPNEVREKRSSALMHLLAALTSPASLMLGVAALLSFFIERHFDGFFIAALLALNVGVTLWHAHKTDHVLETLRSQMSVSAKVMRDGTWQTLPSRVLVTGDVIECGVGALVSADARIDRAVNLEINEAVLTGESLPKEKREGDTAYSGSVVATGTFVGTVTATGNKAFFGTIARSGKEQKRASIMERDIISISRFLILVSIIAIGILTTTFILTGQSLAEIALLDLSLLIAGIPVSLPTVMTLIVSLGAVAVAEKKALVRRLSSLEDFANVTLLLTDKTGTLTQNKISIERVSAYGTFTEEDVLFFGGVAASVDGESAIGRAVVKGMPESRHSSYQVLETVPADSVRKHSTSLCQYENTRYLISFGTPPAITAMCSSSESVLATLHRDIEDAARDGSRAIAVAVKQSPATINDERDMTLVGVVVLADPLRADAAGTVRFLKNEGVNTIMVTGDTKETAAHVAQTLGLTGDVLRVREADIASFPVASFEKTAAFAEVLPEDKLAIVTRAQEQYIVAVTGDGVNDLPAVRRADVGIAVENAVDALKGAADIVLLDSGIGVMQTAIIEARKIFFRLYNYSVYRLSESLRLVLTALVLGLLVGGFPLTPVEVIMVAFLNDIPIITLAFDRVKRTDRPADIQPKERFALGAIFGFVGVLNSLLMYGILALGLHASLAVIQTVFFLKLTVSGHLLIYVAHTKERWWRFLPAKSVIIATTVTQFIATVFAVGGIFVAPIPFSLAVFVWLWALFWMQIGEIGKLIHAKIDPPPATRLAWVA